MKSNYGDVSVETKGHVAVLTFSRPVPLRDRIPAPSGAAVATTAALGISALAAGALTYSVLRRLSW